MDSFYLIVMAIATVMLILILTFVGIMMKQQNAGIVFPPQANTCPDGWAVDGSYCTVPKDGSINIGSYTQAQLLGYAPSNTTNSTNGIIPANDINFQDPVAWASGGLTTVCGQKAWANKYNIAWDGVSNYNSC